ncbi:MAG: aminopeptidase P N-terminal domain-containing protein [Planctomycetes bacterium]|nr:aminopeptidase P N-terminal domain-containing protein [Planctomycetota bacterium]
MKRRTRNKTPSSSATTSLASIHAQRRNRLYKALGGTPLLLRAAPEVLRNGDVHFSYRQDSNFKYLTGFDEPESILVCMPTSTGYETHYFVRPRDKEREIWDGPRAGTRGAIREYGADHSYPISEFWDVFGKMAGDIDELAYPLGSDPTFDVQVLRHFGARFTGRPRRNQGLPSFVDPRPALHEMRLIKSSEEVDLMRRAAEISAAGHRVAMSIAEPGMYEFEVQAELEAVFRREGSPRNGYDSIVATGKNACTLHYIANNAKIKKGDLLLIDAGAEYGHYTADITRTFPVAGPFSDAQRAVYEVVLRCQKKCVALCKPGTTVKKLLETSWRELTKGLVELGILKGSIDKLVEKKAFRPWYMHGLGHWLGMDVHDVGAYEDRSGKPMQLAPGMVTTIEPGLYFANNDKKVPKEFRGIGVRIEDDVLVTKNGPDVLTSGVPKEVREIEELTSIE